MIRLELRGFSDLVSDQVAAVRASATKLLNSGVGSTLRSVLEGNAGVATWIQWLLAEGLRAARLSSASGDDVDSFVGDYGLAREPAGYAHGAVTFSRYTAQGQAIVPVGTLVKTNDDSQTFAVSADASNPAYNTGLSAFVLADGVASISGIPVVASVPGTAGNVVASAIDAISSTLSGVDLVTNPLAFSGGTPAETDAALKARFVAFIASLSKATLAAISFAIASVQPGLKWAISNNADPAGVFDPGVVTIRVDDGSGSPPASLIAAVHAAVDAVRALPVVINVLPPVVVSVTVSLTITVADGYSKAALIAPVQQAVTDFINALGVGATLSLSRLAFAAYAVDPDAITNVSAILVAGEGVDLTPPAIGVIHPAVVTVS